MSSKYQLFMVNQLFKSSLYFGCTHLP